MTLYSIVRGTGYLAATQVPAVPKTLFAVKIKSYVPHILHPLVLWTQVIPPLENGALVLTTLCGDTAKVMFGANLQKIEFTSTEHIPLEITIHRDFKQHISVSRIHHLYALGDECVEKRYNSMSGKGSMYGSKKHFPAYYDVEEPHKLK